MKLSVMIPAGLTVLWSTAALLPADCSAAASNDKARNLRALSFIDIGGTQAGCTASACRPFCPWTTVKETFCPSFRLLKPWI